MIPIYEAIIDDFDTGIYKISLVDSPAVLSDFVHFAKQKEQIKFAIEDEEQRMVTGVIMRADFPIYRISDNLGEYYMKFSKETIKKMVEKMMKDNTFNNINLQHTDGTDVDGVNLIEIFIKNSEKGISPNGFDDIEEGSLFATYKVENDEVWEEIKSGTFKGFSIEAIVNLEEIQLQQIKKKKKNIVEHSICPHSKKNINKKFMSIFNKILKSIIKLGSVETDKGEVYWVGDADLQIGDELFYNTDGEEDVKVEDGDYTLQDGTVIVVTDGVVSEIKEPENEDEPEAVVEELEDETGEEGTEEEVDKYDELKKEIDDLKATVDELKALVDELKNAPAAEPVVEEFKRATRTNSIVPVFGSRSKIIRD